MATVTYTVVKGDTLTAIATKYKTTVSELARLNNIENVDLIYVGQVLVISNDSGESTSLPRATSNKPVILHFGLQSNTDRTIFATWRWSKEHTKEYEVKWYYDTGDNSVWFIGQEGTEKHRQSVWTAPENAKRVRFVVKAVAETHTVNKVETVYWTGDWSTDKVYNFAFAPPTTPPAPSVSLKDYTLTASLDNLTGTGTYIDFQVIKNNANLFSSGRVQIITYHAEYSCTIAAGQEYKVRCRSRRGSVYSDWSEYSENVETMPAAPLHIASIKATSETSVYLIWSQVNTADSYEVQYTTDLRYFRGSDQVSSVNGIEDNRYEKTGLESGKEYFFRVRAVNDHGSSEWTEPRSVIVGKKPLEPTTWSSTTTCVVGEPLTLYWLHNSEDGSEQTYAQVQMWVDDDESTTRTIDSTGDEEGKKTMHLDIDSNEFDVGARIRWRARTAGVTEQYGDWSVIRTVDIYAPPTVSMTLADGDGLIPNDYSEITALPIQVNAQALPTTQRPTSYRLSIVSRETYETVDSVGRIKMVTEGEELYVKNLDTKSNTLSTRISANEVSLDNNRNYTIKCVVAMNSGLTAEASLDFVVQWTDNEYSPNAEIGINPDDLSASIHPFCVDENNQVIPDIDLSVYRRESDGSFVEIVSNLANGRNRYVVDPHPALDFARYRIVATQRTTGGVSYTDIPGYPVGESSIVIQWDEEWSSFDAPNEDAFEQPAWAGSMLKLPYNISMDTQHSMETSLVKYIGRKRPVSYYGTQLGETATWSVEIPKSDRDTLYALRRLAIWPGDVYVREPSGSGYWASITISFSQSYDNLVIPISISVTRVEGGV